MGFKIIFLSFPEKMEAAADMANDFWCHSCSNGVVSLPSPPFTLLHSSVNLCHKWALLTSSVPTLNPSLPPVQTYCLCGVFFCSEMVQKWNRWGKKKCSMGSIPLSLPSFLQ